jgi:hypothetical protein
MLQPMPRRTYRWYVEHGGRSAHAGYSGGHRVVADAMETSLQPGSGTSAHMIGNLLLRQIPRTAALGVGIGLRERSRM